MSWNLYDRAGNFIGTYARPEPAMSVVGTGEIGMKWEALSANQYLGLSEGGAVRFMLVNVNAEMRSALEDIVKYWDMRDPNRGAAFETAITRARYVLSLVQRGEVGHERLS